MRRAHGRAVCRAARVALEDYAGPVPGLHAGTPPGAGLPEARSVYVRNDLNPDWPEVPRPARPNRTGPPGPPGPARPPARLGRPARPGMPPPLASEEVPGPSPP